MKKDILLIFPGEEGVLPRLPLAILSLASYLRKNKISVDILDTKVDDYVNINYDNYSCIGISSMSGEQLKAALEVAKHIKKNYDAILIWGGPHVSFFPDQSIKSKYVDVVVKKEGERALL